MVARSLTAPTGAHSSRPLPPDTKRHRFWNPQSHIPTPAARVVVAESKHARLILKQPANALLGQSPDLRKFPWRVDLAEGARAVAGRTSAARGRTIGQTGDYRRHTGQKPVSWIGPTGGL